MTPEEIREIRLEGDPETMQEALLQWEQEKGFGNDVYGGIVDATRATGPQARLLLLLWKARGHVVPWERIAYAVGCEDGSNLRQGYVKRLKARCARFGVPVAIEGVYSVGLQLTQLGPVPWGDG